MTIVIGVGVRQLEVTIEFGESIAALDPFATKRPLIPMRNTSERHENDAWRRAYPGTPGWVGGEGLLFQKPDKHSWPTPLRKD
jgi:hypothetical protein